MNNMMKEILEWSDIKTSTYTIAKELIEQGLYKNAVVLAPHYGGWPVATTTVNYIRKAINDDSFKPPAITESDLTRHFLIPLLSHKHILIFDDVLDTGKVINGIIWRILHECETFLPKEEILKKIIICTIGKKRDADYNCRHIYTTVWPKDLWVQFAWE
jgi:hypoxanthine phosphoribosyltransferase